MIAILRGFVKSIPTLVLSIALAVAVWISAVNAADPVQQRLFPRTIAIERIGLDPSLVILGEVPSQVSVTLSAPSSIWDQMLNDRAPVRAWVNLAGVSPGQHTLPVNVEALVQPSKVVNWSPRTVTVNLETLVQQEFPINLVRRGDPAVGFQLDAPTLEQENVVVSGPSSLVEQVSDVRVVLDVAQANDTINRVLEVQALDASESQIAGLTITPAQITVNQPVSQRGGYRNVVIKVASTGQVESGYRLTNISVFPPTVTVFATNPSLVDRLPGYVETSPLDLTGVKDDIDVRLPLNLPDGVEVVGDQTVLVQVGVAAIEGSITLSGLSVTANNLSEDLAARLSPRSVDVIISGPLPLLDRLTEDDVTVSIDLSDVGEGTYQFAPKVALSIAELRVESILPSSVEVVVEPMRQVTPTATAAPTAPEPP